MWTPKAGQRASLWAQSFIRHGCKGRRARRREPSHCSRASTAKLGQVCQSVSSDVVGLVGLVLCFLLTQLSHSSSVGMRRGRGHFPTSSLMHLYWPIMHPSHTTACPAGHPWHRWVSWDGQRSMVLPQCLPTVATLSLLTLLLARASRQMGWLKHHDPPAQRAGTKPVPQVLSCDCPLPQPSPTHGRGAVKVWGFTLLQGKPNQTGCMPPKTNC